MQVTGEQRGIIIYDPPLDATPSGVLWGAFKEDSSTKESSPENASDIQVARETRPEALVPKQSLNVKLSQVAAKPRSDLLQKAKTYTVCNGRKQLEKESSELAGNNKELFFFGLLHNTRPRSFCDKT